jgi:formylglycine-generating enzyme required for sulfatase activity
VTITRPFYLGVYEVTQEEYEKVMGENPSFFSAQGLGKAKVEGLDTKRFPVEMVSWKDAVKFCEKTSALPREKEAGRTYRLPTEAEWEYACRGGAPSYQPFHFGDQLSLAQANFAENSSFLGHTTAAGSYKPNGFGLYDMHGNVSEWCSDWHDKDYYTNSPKEDPKGPDSGTGRVLRGGSWQAEAWWCRSAYRAWNDPGPMGGINFGFRVAVDVTAP